jgi:uncharacterized membrane protein
LDTTGGLFLGHTGGIPYGDFVFQLIILIGIILIVVLVSMFFINKILRNVKKNKELEEINRKLDELVKGKEKEE